MDGNSRKLGNKKSPKKKISKKKPSSPNQKRISEPKIGHNRNGSVITKKKLLENVHIIDEQLKKYSLLTALEKKTGLSRVVLLFGILGCTLFFLIYGFGIQILGHVIAVVWPGYRSFLVIETLGQLVEEEKEVSDVHGRSKQDQIDELKKYKNLKIQFNMLRIEENYEDLAQGNVEEFLAKEKKELISVCNEKAKRYLMYWIVYGLFYLAESLLKLFTWMIPFYPLIKLAFLFWCGSPRYKGAVSVYHNVFAPVMHKYQTTFTSWIDTAQAIVKTTMTEIKGDTQTAMAEHQGKIMAQGMKVMTQFGQMQNEKNN